jgi:hypothetical protein
MGALWPGLSPTKPGPAGSERAVDFDRIVEVGGGGKGGLRGKAVLTACGSGLPWMTDLVGAGRYDAPERGEFRLTDEGDIPEVSIDP